MKIHILGSGREVGRSAILIEDNTKILLDAGVKIQPEPPKYPMIQKPDTIIISHAHLDHSGSAPLFYKKWSPKIIMNDITLELSRLLINDSIKIARKEGYGVPFSKHHLKRMIKNTQLIGYNRIFRIKNFSCALYDAGHIPGSCSILLNNGKKIFYTADIQTIDTNLLKRAYLPKKCDILILESTYSYKNHPDRKNEERKLINSVQEVLAKEETALIPVFAVGRAQEILLILEDYARKIALDGMAKTATDIIASHGKYLKNDRKLKNVMRKINWIRTNRDRERAIKKFPILVSSAGMLGGGPAIHYLRGIRKRRESKVVFCGFLVEDSPGRNLIQTKIFENAEERFHVHCELEQFELSAHTDRSGLFDIVRRLEPEQVICVHGEKCEAFANDISDRFGILAYAPKNGEVIEI